MAMIRTVFGLALLWSAAACGADGAQLYGRHCAVCHGDDGQGGVGVPLALPDFQAVASDAYLARTIRLGRPGRIMPAFANLSDAEIQAIVDHIRGFAHVERPRYDEEQRILGDAARGRQLFAEHCAACHGENGEGGEGTGVTFSRPRDLPIIAPSLNNDGFLAAASDAMIRATLRRGRQGTPMPSFLKQGLSEQDIDDIVAFVRSLAGTQPPRPDHSGEPAVLSYESPYDFEQTIANLKEAIIGKNFRLIRDQALEEGMVEPGQERPGQLMVYFCNFKFLYDALAVDPRVGLFLPCRVTVLERQGKVEVMSINPRRLSYYFNNARLDQFCDEMYQVYTDILEEATL